MLPRLPHIVLATLLTAIAGTACAQPAPAPQVAATSPAPTPELAAAPASAPPMPRIEPLQDPALPRIEQALSEASRGGPGGLPGGLADHPLARWVAFAGLSRDLERSDESQVVGFIARHRDEAVGAEMRRLWLASRSRRNDHAGFLRRSEEHTSELQSRE